MIVYLATPPPLDSEVTKLLETNDKIDPAARLIAPAARKANRDHAGRIVRAHQRR